LARKEVNRKTRNYQKNLRLCLRWHFKKASGVYNGSITSLLYERERMKKALLAGLIIVASIVGCVPSIHGIATRENKVWDESLIGTWSEPNETSKTVLWRFDKGTGDKMYSLIYVDEKGKAGRFDVAMVKIGEGDIRFLDVYPKDLDDEMNSFYKGHWIPAHTIVMVTDMDEKLQVKLMDPDKVKKLLEKEPNALKHETVEDAVLITAGTDELLNFIKRHLDDIWMDPVSLVKKK
jgi:hypothetical protein